MSSFQFPANPSDGDIVVRGNLQAFYNAATNTWRVSEVPTAPGIPGPPGPPGPIGPPGQGLEVSGSVATQADLPAANTAQFEFWIVDDTNTLYYSDGMNWTDFGSPIQGPKGDDGDNGADGTNGQNGRGWYDTSVDTSNGEYKVTFLSNDGLTFTTDNLKGPKGDDGDDGDDGEDFTGTLPIATETTVGVVKVGDGLAIDTAGVLTTDLNTVDVTPETPNVSSALYYKPGYWNKEDGSPASIQQYASGPAITYSNQTITLPSTANGAIVYFFTGSFGTPYGNRVAYPPGNPMATGLLWSSYANLTATLTVKDGVSFVNGGNSIGLNTTLNFAVGNEARRSASAPALKLGQVTFPFGTSELKFDVSIALNAAQRMTVRYGRARVIVIPYRDTNNTTTRMAEWNAMTPKQRGIYAMSIREIDWDAVEGSDPDQIVPTPTPEEMLRIQAEDLSNQIGYYLRAIDVATNGQYSSGPTYDLLIAKRQEILNLQFMAGDADDVQEALDAIASEIGPYTEFQFTFAQ